MYNIGVQNVVEHCPNFLTKLLAVTSLNVFEQVGSKVPINLYLDLIVTICDG